MKNGRVKQLTVCAALSAIGVVLLSIGHLIDVLDASLAVLASIVCIVAVIEYGKAAPWLVFSVTATLSLILIPPNSAALMYLMFFGYYPILKEKLERLPRVLSWVVKELIFNTAMVICIALITILFMPTTEVTVWTYAILVLLCEVVFVLYDIALTRLISFYIYKLRTRFKF
ncbi:MAG: hypothetical protein E7677_00680 [Ruminococcaceae bacterium]|nr:hypothetical protein [Oscillospiraceae bacterium]